MAKAIKLTEEVISEVNADLKGLNIPVHRSYIDRNGANIKWLRKHLLVKNDKSQISETTLAVLGIQ